MLAVLGIVAITWTVVRATRAAPAQKWEALMRSDEPVPIRVPRPLTAEEARWANAAWRYFVRNTAAATGLVASYEGAGTTSIWDTGSYVMAMIAAHRLGVIDIEEFNDRMSRLLDSLARLPLFENALPNREYDIASLSMVGPTGETDLRGVGWSAIDISRLLLAIKIVCWEYPYFTPQVRDILGRWSLHHLTSDGALQVARLDRRGNVSLRAEGRLGYEAYAARVLTMYNADTRESADLRATSAVATLHGVPLLVDRRLSFPVEGLSLVNSDPYLFHGLELGWDPVTARIAYQVFRVHQQRYASSGHVTVAGTGYLAEPTRRVHCAVLVDDSPWRCVSDDGEFLRGVSFFDAGAAVAWAALLDTDFADILRAAAVTAHDRQHGWRTGHFMDDARPVEMYSAQTNALVLEAVHFTQRGPLLNLLGDSPSDYLSYGDD